MNKKDEYKILGWVRNLMFREFWEIVEEYRGYWERFFKFGNVFLNE